MAFVRRKRYEALLESNSALKDANCALKDLVNSLKNERAVLLAKNKALETKLAIKHMKHERVKEPSSEVSGCVASKLPHTVLLDIFSSLILPRDEHNSSVAAGPRSQWLVSLNTRTACVLVCKHWYSPASQALYSDIVLRRMGQILALARTLRSTAAIFSPDRSRFVRSICINECIILPAAETVVKEDLTFLLRRCTNLRTFSLRACSRILGGELTVDRAPRGWFNPTWYWDTSDSNTPGSALSERCATSLEELILADPLVGHHMKQVNRLLSVAANLRKLVLGPLPKECDLSETLSELQADSLSLPTLEDLQLPNQDDALRSYIQEAWDLPALQRLTLVSCKHFPREFLEIHGTNLKYLHLLHQHTTASSTWSELELLEHLCPTLEHLILPYMPVYSPPSVIQSSTLRYLDMWGLTLKRRVVELMLELGLMSGMPSLERIRILPHYDEGILPTSLPLLCHPEDVDGDDTRVRVFPGVYILQTSWALLVHRHLSTKSDGVVFDNDPWANSASDGSSWCEEEDVTVGEGEEGSEEAGDELETASEVDSICAAAERGRQGGDQNSDGVREKETGDEAEADEAETEIERDEEPEEVKQASERRDDEEERKGYFTREELLRRFWESQREDFILDGEL